MDFSDTILLSRTAKFSGADADNWDTWISRFEGLTRDHKDGDRVKRLIALLDGAALDSALVCLGDVKAEDGKDKDSYLLVRGVLAARFGKPVSQLQARAELGRAAQAPGESTENFADRILKLGRLACPEATCDDKIWSSNLTSRFICGLRDEWLQAKLCNRDPQTLQEALLIARDLRSRQEALQAVKSANPAGQAISAAAVPMNPGQNDDPGAHGTMDSQLAHLEQQVYDLRSTLQALAVSGTHPSALNSGPGPQCYRCGSLGHLRRNCTFRRRRSPGGSDACYGCGTQGHFQRDCPYKLQSNSRSRPFCLCCGRGGHWMASCDFNRGGNEHQGQRNNTIRPAGVAQSQTRSEN